jgi:5-methylcytosine-specific restriction endonuclease McrA
MALIKSRHKRRAQAFLFWAALALAVLFALPVWARWLLAVPVMLAVVVTPMLTRGGRSALRQAAFTTRQARIEARKPRWDPVAGKEVRPRRPAVPDWLVKVIFAADRHRCVYCHRGPKRRGDMQAKIQLDHIKPYSLGFNATVWNSATLCAQHNLVKSSYWKSDSGREYYRPWAHASAMGEAGKIARTELRVRLYPWRIARMAVAYWLRKGK